MYERGLIVRKNGKIVLKAGFGGDVVKGIADKKAEIEALNPGDTFVYQESAADQASFRTAEIDLPESATLNRGN